MYNIRLLVACGMPINNDSIKIYRQSTIPQHSELAIILNNFAYYGELSRMTQFKDKSSDTSSVTSGLFTYPVLMAADILLYGAKWIPVGEDQRQHIEYTRDLATRFNNKFGDILVVPETLQKQMEIIDRSSAPRIRSLRNPEKKMSKSVEDPAGTIKLSDTPDEARKKIMSATTDSLGCIDFNWDTQPGVSNLLQILALLRETSLDQTIAEWKGSQRYGDLKKAVADAVATTLQSIQTAMDSVDPQAIEQKLLADEQAMRDAAGETLHTVQVAVGLRA